MPRLSPASFPAVSPTSRRTSAQTPTPTSGATEGRDPLVRPRADRKSCRQGHHAHHPPLYARLSESKYPLRPFSRRPTCFPLVLSWVSPTSRGNQRRDRSERYRGQQNLNLTACRQLRRSRGLPRGTLYRYPAMSLSDGFPMGSLKRSRDCVEDDEQIDVQAAGGCRTEAKVRIPSYHSPP